MFQTEYFSQDPAQKLGHIVLCTRGKTREKRGRKTGKKEEEREKGYDQHVNISSSQKSLIFTNEQGVEKGGRNFHK